MLIKTIAIGLTIAFLSLSGLGANSIFSFHGFPVHESSSDLYGTGMGETGIGDVFRKNTGFLNPSLSTTLNQVYFSSGLVYGLYYYYDDQDNEFRKDGLHFPYFNVIIPLKRHRIGFDFTPVLSGNSDFYSYDNEIDIDGYLFQYNEINKVRSYLYKASLLYAYKHRIADAGISFDYYLGHRFRAWSQEDNGTEAAYSIDSKYEFNKTFRNPGVTIGLNRRMGNLSLGIMYRKSVTMKGDKELVTRHSVYDLGESSFDLPDKIGFGSAFRLTDNFRLTTDLEYDLWSKTDSYEDPSDTYKVAFGLAFEPYWGDEKWYKNIPLRTGGYYRILPFQVNGNDLSEMGVTFGFTLPLPSPNAQLDFAFKYLIRGDSGKNGYQDKNILFGIGLSGFDFFRSRPRKIEHRDIPEAEFEGFR